MGGSTAGAQYSQVLLALKQCKRLLVEGRRGHDLDKQLCHPLGGLPVERPVYRYDAAKGTYRVGGKGFVIGTCQGISRGEPARIAVLDDRHSRCIEVLGRLPTAVQVQPVVVAHLLAVELLKRGRGVAVPVEGALLMRVFSIAHHLHTLKIQPNLCRHLFHVIRLRPI